MSTEKLPLLLKEGESFGEGDLLSQSLIKEKEKLEQKNFFESLSKDLLKYIFIFLFAKNSDGHIDFKSIHTISQVNRMFRGTIKEIKTDIFKEDGTYYTFGEIYPLLLKFKSQEIRLNRFQNSLSSKSILTYQNIADKFVQGYDSPEVSATVTMGICCLLMLGLPLGFSFALMLASSLEGSDVLWGFSWIPISAMAGSTIGFFCAKKAVAVKDQVKQLQDERDKESSQFSSSFALWK